MGNLYARYWRSDEASVQTKKAARGLMQKVRRARREPRFNSGFFEVAERDDRPFAAGGLEIRFRDLSHLRSPGTTGTRGW